MTTQTSKERLIYLTEAEELELRVIGHVYQFERPVYSVFERAPGGINAIMTIEQVTVSLEAVTDFMWSSDFSGEDLESRKAIRSLMKKLSMAQLEMELKEDIDNKEVVQEDLSPTERELMIRAIMITFFAMCLEPGEAPGDDDEFCMTPTRKEWILHMWRGLKITRDEAYIIFKKYGKEGERSLAGITFDEYADQIWKLLEDLELI